MYFQRNERIEAGMGAFKMAEYVLPEIPSPGQEEDDDDVAPGNSDLDKSEESSTGGDNPWADLFSLDSGEF
jgi:hypothetical protein